MWMDAWQDGVHTCKHSRMRLPNMCVHTCKHSRMPLPNMWMDAWQDGVRDTHMISYPVLLGPHFFWGSSAWTLLFAAICMGIYLAVRVVVWVVVTTYH